MAKKKNDTVPKVDRPIAKVVSPRKAIEVDNRTMELRKLNEIAELIWLPEGLEEGERNARMVRALELYEDLKPVGSAEGMLAAQMVGTHSAALECLRRAVIPSQTFEGRNMGLNHAQKLMALYTKQLATLDKHRGKGQQKVTVEHVNVAAGGQAIVGNVETGRTSRRGDEQAEELEDIEPGAIEHAPEVPLPETKSRRKAPRKRS